MQNDSRQGYARFDEIDFSLPAIPPRSRFYCLEPVGVGTPYVECLTSYICRLADEHSVLVSSLYCREINLSPLNVRHPSANKQSMSMVAGNGMNGLGYTAEKVVRRLEILTCRKDIPFLTMLPWSRVMTGKGLQRSTQAWCPACLEESRGEGQSTYIPLIWSLASVTTCVKHQRRLRSDCPWCGKKIPWLTSSSRCGFCSSCKLWLGDTSKRAAVDDYPISGEELARQRWIHDVTGECVAGAASLADFPAKERLMESLSFCINAVSEGHIGKFGRLIDTHPHIVGQWKAGNVIPRHQIIIEICAHARVTLFDFYTGNIKVGVLPPVKKVFEYSRPSVRGQKDWIAIEQTLRAALHETPPPSFRKVFKRVDTAAATLMTRLPDLCSKIVARYARHRKSLRKRFLRSIKAIAVGNEYPPPSISEVARRLNTRRERIKVLAPESYARIIKRYSDYRGDIYEESKKRLREEIKQVATAIHEEGERPSFPRVASCLCSPGQLSCEDAREVLREVQRELGYR